MIFRRTLIHFLLHTPPWCWFSGILVFLSIDYNAGNTRATFCVALTACCKQGWVRTIDGHWQRSETVFDVKAKSTTPHAVMWRLVTQRYTSRDGKTHPRKYSVGCMEALCHSLPKFIILIYRLSACRKRWTSLLARLKVSCFGGRVAVLATSRYHRLHI